MSLLCWNMGLNGRRKVRMNELAPMVKNMEKLIRNGLQGENTIEKPADRRRVV